MAYTELIKNFERVREYMRQFYLYGFKRREEYSVKSARSYDDDRRRIETWLGEYMGFKSGANGKNVFISIDSRAVKKILFLKRGKPAVSPTRISPYILSSLIYSKIIPKA